ncbi:MAG: Nif3-like dinuclear metal center hexameric protein [Clostridiales bacterium]|jgi:dinuclear metal center YbgI/SA1388 family protein|nr:Nif3-like dinuclear metal center hexameric protein [Clostridiales bacterium]
MAYVKEIAALMEEIAPPALAQSWDNAGLIIGWPDAPVTRVLAALDCADEVITEAAETGAELIITHHPPIFKGITRITPETGLGRRLLRLIGAGISVYAAHTNLDAAEGGTNDAFCRAVGLREAAPLIVGGSPIGRVGLIESDLAGLAGLVSKAVGFPAVSFTGAPERRISRAAVCVGSAAGNDFFAAARAASCEVYITGDISYHSAQAAADAGLCLINTPHFYTENLVIPPLCELLREKARKAGLSAEITPAKSARDVFTLARCFGLSEKI